MTITPIGSNPAAASAGAGDASRISAQSETSKVTVTFAPGNAESGPLDRVGAGVISKLKQFEARRADSANSMQQMHSGPANPVDLAKAKLLSGPASKSLSAGTASSSGVQPSRTGDAVEAMTRSFDYAIETQLIVKTGSQLSTSASSLMRGQ